MVAAALAGCGGGDDTSGPPPVASVSVTSPVEDVMAAGRSVQLEATAEDGSGNALSGRAFAWESSDPTVASVDDAGLVEGLESGTATITATADGVSGSLEMEVVAADLEAVSALLDDPFTAELAAGLTDTSGDRIDTALQECAEALNAGHVLNLDACLKQVRDESGAGLDDRVLLAVLALIAERSELLLDL